MLELFTVKDRYIKYLQKSDPTVCYNKNHARPYIGIVLSIGNIHYYAPLSSPKPKHLTMKTTLDMVKIHNGEYGVINLNNMIPILPSEIERVNINNVTDVQYKNFFCCSILT